MLVSKAGSPVHRTGGGEGGGGEGGELLINCDLHDDVHDKVDEDDVDHDDDDDDENVNHDEVY